MLHFPLFSWQAFEVEVANHRPRLEATLASGEDLVVSQNLGASNVKDEMKKLEQMWKELEDQTAHRMEMLDCSLEAQKVADNFLSKLIPNDPDQFMLSWVGYLVLLTGKN